jgi:hypothetical protein
VNPSLPAAAGGMPEDYKDEWDMVISEYGLDSEPMALPMSRAEVKKRLLARAAEGGKIAPKVMPTNSL